jgi:intein/homing endonuclease
MDIEKVYTGNYHDGRTEVLTEDGWKLFKNISIEDKLASVNVNTRELFYETPLNIFSKKYSGDMYVGKCRFLGFKVTPDHKLFIRPMYIESDDNSISPYSYTIMNELPPFFKTLKYKYEGSYYGEINVRLSKDILIEKYTGWIYSAEMSTHHNLLTRRNGKVLLSES